MKYNSTVDKTIELIEQLAINSSLQGLPVRNNAIELTDIDTEIKNSLIANDVTSLEKLLDLNTKIRCQGIHPGQPDEEGQEEQEEQEELPDEKANGMMQFAI